MFSPHWWLAQRTRARLANQISVGFGVIVRFAAAMLPHSPGRGLWVFLFFSFILGNNFGKTFQSYLAASMLVFFGNHYTYTHRHQHPKRQSKWLLPDSGPEELRKTTTTKHNYENLNRFDGSVFSSRHPAKTHKQTHRELRCAVVLELNFTRG